jgi:hypothetical protein
MRFHNMSTRSTSCWCQARGPKSKVLAGRAGEERGLLPYISFVSLSSIIK